jgi:hypothetical protein
MMCGAGGGCSHAKNTLTAEAIKIFGENLVGGLDISFSGRGRRLTMNAIASDPDSQTQAYLRNNRLDYTIDSGHIANAGWRRFR